MRAAGGIDVGIVLNLAPIWPERPEAADVADGVDAIRNRVWLDPLVDGAYDDGLLRVAPELADPELVRDGDLALMQGSADWLGINYYTPVRVAEGSADTEHPEGGAYPGVAPFELVERDPRTDIGWEIDASGLEELLVETHRRTSLPLLVMENGAACDDDRVEDGRVADQDRIDYPARPPRRHRRRPCGRRRRPRLRGLDAARQLRVGLRLHQDVRPRHIDLADQTRTPKASYDWLAGVARERTEP